MGQSYTGAMLQSSGLEPSLYRAPDGTLFTVDSDGKAVGLDGVALSPVPSGNAYLAGDGPHLGFDDANGTAIIVQSDGSYTLPDGSPHTLVGTWRPWGYEGTTAAPDPCAGIISPGSDDLYVTGTSGVYAGAVDIATLPGFANMTGPPDTVMFALTTDINDNRYSWLTFDALPDAGCKTVTGGSLSLTMGAISNTENHQLIVYYGAAGAPVADLRTGGTNPPPNATTTYALSSPQALALSLGTADVLLGVGDHSAVASVFNVDAIKLTLDWV